MILSLSILAAVFLLIAVRQVGNLRLPIWQVMLAGAVLTVATGQISPANALRAINFKVLIFLFGMFVVGQALEDSGYLEALAYGIFSRARSLNQLLFLILFAAGIGSMLLMNDTLAIVGTPVVLGLARSHRIDAKVLLLALAFAVTIGSTASPIGNPQNLLIALDGGVPNPFVTFARWLLLPTLANLGLAFLFLRRFHRDSFHDDELVHTRTPIADPQLARLSRIGASIVLALIAAKIVFLLLGYNDIIPLPAIALIPAALILLLTRSRRQILRRVDWQTILFFAAMFVLMESVWQTGFFQSLLNGHGWNLSSSGIIMTIASVLSQFISNVPLVALLQPLILHAGASMRALMALAAGSTIAGNLSILGAASNVIIIHNAEKRTGDTLTFFEFARVGFPLGLINLLIYWLFIHLI